MNILNILLEFLVYKVASLKKITSFWVTFILCQFICNSLRENSVGTATPLILYFSFQNWKKKGSPKHKNCKTTIFYRFSIFISFLKFRWQNFVMNNTLRNFHKTLFKTFSIEHKVITIFNFLSIWYEYLWIINTLCLLIFHKNIKGIYNLFFLYKIL